MTGTVLGVGHCTVVARVVAPRGTGGAAPVPHNECKASDASELRPCLRVCRFYDPAPCRPPGTARLLGWNCEARKLSLTLNFLTFELLNCMNTYGEEW